MVGRNTSVGKAGRSSCCTRAEDPPGLFFFRVLPRSPIAVSGRLFLLDFSRRRLRIPGHYTGRKQHPVERRVYFLFGDIVANACIGAVAGLTASAIVDSSWNMLVAMVVAMLVGHLIAMLGSLIFTPLFGGFEVMLPGMLGGMESGMIVGMAAAMRPVGTGQAVVLGALIGLAVLSATAVLNDRIRGRAEKLGDGR